LLTILIILETID